MALVAVSLAPLATQADVIARYDFAGGSAAAAESSPSVTAGDYNPLLGSISSSTGTHFINGNIVPATLTPIAEFTVTVDVGTLNLSSLDFGYRTDNADADPQDIFSLAVRSSLDGFTSDIYSETRDMTTGTTNNPVSVDLTGLDFQGLTDPITFQWLASDNTEVNTERTRIAADVILNGQITGGAPELAITANRDNGEITIENIGGAALDFIGYSITGDGGLNPGNWASIADTYDVDGSSATQVSGDNWTKLTNPLSDSDLSEFDFESAAGASIGAGQSLSLGVGAWTPTRFENLNFDYRLPDGTSVEPTVNYIGNGGEPFANGDLDSDGDIDAADWNALRTNLGGEYEGESRVALYLRGDLNGDADVDAGDFVTFQGLYDDANGAGAFAALLAVPEPGSVSMLALAGLGAVALRGRRLATLMLALVGFGLLGAPAAQAQLSEDFEGLTVGDAASQLPGWTFLDLGDINNDALWQISDDATSGSAFGSLHLSQSTTAPDFYQTNQPIAGALAIANNTDVDTVDVIDFDISLGGFGDGSGQFLDAKLIFGYRDQNNFYAMNFVAGQANGTNTELDISTIRVLDGETEPTRSNVFDTFSTGNFDAGFSTSPAVLHGQLIHDSDVGSVSFTISEAGQTVFSGSVTSEEFLLDGDIGFGVNNDAVSFDNLVVRALPRLTLQVDPVDGDTRIVNAAGEAIELDLYEITSDADQLDPIAWNSLEEQNLVGFEAGDGSGDGWEAGDASNAGTLVEANLLSNSSFGDSQSIYLGEAVLDGVTEGIAWRYHVPGAGNSFINGRIEYTDVTAPIGIDGDYNNDGVVNAADYTVWRDNLGQSVTLPNDTTPGTVTQADYDVWSNNYGNTSTSTAVAVPEPTGVLLAALSALLCGTRRRVRAAAVVAAASVGVASSASAIEIDRLYGLGEEEGASAGASVTSTFDATSPFIDLTGNNGAQYVTLSGRPGAAQDSSTLGVSFDGLDDYLSGLRFGNPETSRGSIGTTVGTPFGTAKNYTGLRNRGLQLWVNPNSAGSGSRQSVIHDTNQFGLLINEAGNWVLQSNGAEHDSGLAVAFDDWTHVAVHRQFGAGIVLYVNGVATARTGSAYDTNDTANLIVGSNTAGDEVDPTGAGTMDYFNGVLDQIELYTWGESGEGPGSEPAEDFGDFNFGRDNGFARLPVADGGVSKVAGDITGDGLLNSSDVDAFVANWQAEGFIDFIPDTGGSANNLIGDISSLSRGDFDYDGDTDLDDAFTLHTALVAATGQGLDFSRLTAVPEPASAALLSIGLLAAGCRRRC